MESNTMSIKNTFHPNDERFQFPLELEIKMKTQDIDARGIYHAIVTIMNWAQARHQVNAQQILDWLKEKNFVSEHFYNPVV